MKSQDFFQRQRQVPVTLANRAAVAAELHHRLGARIILSGADVSRVGSSEAQVPREAEKYPLVMSNGGGYIYSSWGL